MIGLIAICDLNHLIAKNNIIPWHNKTDLKRFSEITKNCIVIVGRITYETLPGDKLPGRIKYIISNNYKYETQDIKIFTSLDKAIKEAKQQDKDTWIIGGEQIYKQSLENFYPEKIDLTIIRKRTTYFGNDNCKFFPKVPLAYKIIKDYKNETDPILLHIEYELRTSKVKIPKTI